MRRFWGDLVGDGDKEEDPRQEEVEYRPKGGTTRPVLVSMEETGTGEDQ
jgi:hypothetical protein